MSQPLLLFLVTAAIGGFALLAILYTMSTAMIRQTAIMDLRREAQRLRDEYTRRIEELRRGREMSVEILSPGQPQDGAPPDFVEQRAAA